MDILTAALRWQTGLLNQVASEARKQGIEIVIGEDEENDDVHMG
jgi:hypothetical protein